MGVLCALLDCALRFHLCLILLYFYVGIMFSWLSFPVCSLAISIIKCLCVFSLLFFLESGRHYLRRLFWLGLMYLLRLIFCIMVVVLLTFFVYGFPFLLRCFASSVGFCLLNLLRKICLRFHCIGIVLILLCFSIWEVWSVFIGRTLFFSKFMVEPVPLLSFSKKFITNLIDSCSFNKKFESCSYWLIFISLLLFGILIPLMF